MSGFGDWEAEDSADSAPPDPEALARIFVILLRTLSRDRARAATLDDLHPWEAALYVFAFHAIVERLKREWTR